MNAGLAERHARRPLARFEFRAVRPAFDGESLAPCLRRDSATAFALWSRNADGHLTMTATA